MFLKPYFAFMWAFDVQILTDNSKMLVDNGFMLKLYSKKYPKENFSCNNFVV